MKQDTAVLQQELKNISSQLAEMQGTMIMWMTFQNELYAEQQKKTPRCPTISANSRYVLPNWKRGLRRRRGGLSAASAGRRPKSRNG